jgi:hypothetical protein
VLYGLCSGIHSCRRHWLLLCCSIMQSSLDQRCFVLPLPSTPFVTGSRMSSGNSWLQWKKSETNRKIKGYIRTLDDQLTTHGLTVQRLTTDGLAVQRLLNREIRTSRNLVFFFCHFWVVAESICEIAYV